MQLRIISTEREILSMDVVRIILPGASGQMEILPSHAKLLSLLKNGEITYFHDGSVKDFSIDGGLVEVNNDNVCVFI